MRVLILVIVGVLGSLFAYGKYNGMQARKYREEKNKVLVNKQIEEYWPQAQGVKIVTYPKRLSTNNSNKSQQPWLDTSALLEKLENILTGSYAVASSLFSKIEIRTAKTSNSPFIDLFSQKTEKAKPVIAKKPSNIKRATTVVSKPIERERSKPIAATSTSFVTKTIPMKTVPIETVPLEVEQLPIPIPIVNDNRQIEICHMGTPPVPRANFDYAVVNFSR